MASPDDGAGATRATFPIGIAGEDLHPEERDLPAGEPPPWPANADLRVVGKRTRRLDGRAKVTGQARYTSDVRLRGLLHARRIVSTVPHARIRGIDTSAAERLPGVRAVHLLGKPVDGPVLRDASVEAGGRFPTVRYVGQPLGAIAATSPEIADEAVRLVRVEYEPLPFTVDLDEALRPDAPLVYPGPVDQEGSAGGGGSKEGLPQRGNLRGPVKASRGDVEKGFAEADVVVEAAFTTQVQTHSALETHGVVADWQPDGLVVYASTQGVVGVRDDLAEWFSLPPGKVRVVTDFMGGGFGAKFGAGHYGILAAALSRKAGRPVRLVLDRREEHTSVGNRPATRQKLRIGAKRDGALTAVALEAVGTAGVGTGAGVGFCAERMYACPSFSGSQADVFVNAGPGAAFRAPGMPQGIFALEGLLDELADRLGMDPLALRDRIDTVELSGARARKVERRVGAEKVDWARRRHPPGAEPGPVKRGLGFAQAIWPHIVFVGAECEVVIARSGAVEVRSATQDIGTGTRTVLAQVVAEELGLRLEDVAVRIGDSALPPGPGSGGSNVTGTITPVARAAAHEAGLLLRTRAARRLGVAPDALTLRDGAAVVAADPARRITFREAAALGKDIRVRRERKDNYGHGGGPRGAMGGVQFAEVAVDVETGIVRVERIVAVHDCGRPVNPLAVESQVNGGILHGLSWALLEDRILDRATGRMVNPNLEQYKLAGARETPRIEVVLLEEYRGRSATDATGIGEPANIATAAAIANAVHNAVGVRVRDLPITPARVLAALATRRG
ncbi:xanthine dehydrogenase family protein molybdopterin-binding subunit [Anaeromyxobacter oryzae]|uniref:Xanthine dehydrogenase n=1 Tax=Anaeromyxobacter oryzae TaxID=2918170 RepID=A0ABM7WUM3_9BACT|nr:xanthine dehydrogenase family protein molybdopterin-binding subunit [Anaeromyxobacter oryzae]BDG03191.1 xanthine dehydrogenase [Anaeromyxobacter oryzae]